MKTAGILALGCFLLLTNRWLSYQEGISIMKANDIRDYMTIAVAAPELPAKPIVFHRAQRFAVPFLVGVLADFSGITHQKVFLFVALLCCTLVIVAVNLILDDLKLNPSASFLCLALLVLNPYVFRYFLAVPAMMNDLVFTCGLTIGILGLLRKNFSLVVAALILAALARQTALLLLPGFILWFYFGPGWREYGSRQKLFHSLIICITVFSVYKLTSFVASSFSAINVNRFQVMGIFYWFKSTFSPAALIEFLARGLIPHLFPVVLLIMIHFRFPRKSYSPEFWICIVITVAILLQPILAGPVIAGRNISRLSTLGFLPLLTALAIRFRELPLNFLRWRFLLLFSFVVLGSFHHMYSIVAGDSRLAVWFSLIYFGMALSSGLLFLFNGSEKLIQEV